MSSKFHDQASYIAAFLAVAVGLMVFRAELTGVAFTLLHWDTNLFEMVAVFVVLLVFSTYISALAVMSTSFNVTRFPLTSWLESFANFCIALGLLSPFVVGIVYGVERLMNAVLNAATEKTYVSALLSLAVGLVSGVTVALLFVRIKRQRRLEESYYHWETNTSPDYFEPPRDGTRGCRPPAPVPERRKTEWGYEFLEHYEYTLAYVKEYLRARGYGIRTSSLGFVAKLLYDKSIIPADLYRKVSDVNTLRNNLAHAQGKPSRQQLQKAQSVLDELFEVIQPKFAALVGEEVDSSA